MPTVTDAPYTVRVLTEDGELFADNTTATGEALETFEHDNDAWQSFDLYVELLTYAHREDVAGLTVQMITGDDVTAEHRIEA